MDVFDAVRTVLAVRAYRDEPVPRDVIDRVVESAIDAGLATVRLHVTEGNARAERVYERNGFSRSGNTVVRDRDGVVEVEMERSLP